MAEPSRGQNVTPQQPITGTPVAGESQAQADARARALADLARQQELAKKIPYGRGSPAPGVIPEEPPAGEIPVPKEVEVKPAVETELIEPVQPPKVDLSRAKPDYPGANYTTINGQRYYLPGTTPYQQGFRTVGQWQEMSAGRGGATVGPNIAVKDSRGNWVQITKAEAFKLNQLMETNPEEYVNQRVRMGLLPEGSEYISGTGDNIRYTTPVQREAQQIINITSKKYRDAYSKANQAGIITETGDIDVSAALGKGVPENVLITLGVPQNTINAYRRATGAAFVEYGAQRAGTRIAMQAKWDELQSYGKEGKFSLSQLANYARKNGYGFLQTLQWDDPLIIQQIKNYNNEQDIAVNEVESMLINPKRGSGETLALEGAITESGIRVEPKAARAQYITSGLSAGAVIYFDEKGKAISGLELLKSRWNQLTDEQKREVAMIYSSDKYKSSYFAEYAHEAEKAAIEGGRLGELAFAPVIGITTPVAKAMTGQPVSAMEWAGAGVTAALDALFLGGGFGSSLIGKITSGAIRGGSTIYMGINLTKNWNDYDIVDKALTAGFMGLLWSGEAYTGAKTLVKGGKANVTIDASIKAAAKDVTTELQHTTPELVKPFENVVRAQGEYARNLAKMESIQKQLKGEGLLEVQKARLQGELADIQAKIAASEENMMRLAGDYAARSSNLATDPIVASNMKMLPQYLRQSTYDLVHNVMNPRGMSEIIRDFNRARKDLQKVVTENPDNPATWQESAFKVVAYGRELSIAKAGGAAKMYNQLIKLTEQYQNVLANLRGIRATESPTLRAILERTARELDYRIAQMKADIQNTMYEMEVIYGEDVTSLPRASWQTEELIKTIRDNILKRGGKGIAKGWAVDIPPTLQEIKLLGTRAQLGRGGGRLGTREGLPKGEELPPSSNPEANIKANEGFIKTIDDFLKNKNVKNQSRLDAILKAQEEARRQVKTAIKEVTKPIETIRVISPEEAGKMLPAKVERAKVPAVRKAPRPTPRPAPTTITSPREDIFRRLWRGTPAWKEKPVVQEERIGVMTPEQAQRFREYPEITEARSPYIIPRQKPGQRIEPIPSTVTSPSVEPLPYPIPATEIQPETMPYPETAPQPEPKPEPQPLPMPEPAPIPEPAPYPYPEPFPQPRPEPIRPPTPPPISPPVTTTKISPMRGIISMRGSGVRRRVSIPEGSIAYKKGLFWKYIAPSDFRNGVKPQTLPRGIAPIGADVTGGNSPYNTIQRIGESGAPVPEAISIDEGIVDAYITLSGGKISYSGGGLRTNVGERIDSTTTGMSVPAKGHAYARKIYPQHSISRTAITENTVEPVRGVSEIREYRPGILEEDTVPYEDEWPIGTFPDEENGKKDKKEKKEKKDKHIQGKNRYKNKKQHPVRGRNNDFSDLTSLKGIRW